MDPRRRILRFGWFSAILLVGIAILGPKPAMAQVLQGYLLDDSTGVGIDGATVSLIRGDRDLRSVVASSSGWFSFVLPDSGSYRLRAQRLGYATTQSQPLFIPPGDTVTVEFRIRTEAVQMAPLIVTASRARGWGQFRERMENWGKGIYMTPAVVDSIDPRHPADVFRNQDRTWLSWDFGRRKAVPKIRTFLGSGCVAYLLDGMPVESRMWGSLWEDSPLSWIEGEDVVAVEYYRYIGEVPPELQRFAEDDSDHQCGLVVFWTAAGW